MLVYWRVTISWRPSKKKYLSKLYRFTNCITKKAPQESGRVAGHGPTESASLCRHPLQAHASGWVGNAQSLCQRGDKKKCLGSTSMFPKWPYDSNPVKAEWMDCVMNYIIQFFLNLEREKKTILFQCCGWLQTIYIYIFQKKSIRFFPSKSDFMSKTLSKKNDV